MKQGEDVFRLICTLTVPEKRYFRLFAKRHVIGSKNNYEHLFDLIEKQAKNGSYDEDVILKNLSAAESKNIAAGKHYLYELILRSMRSFHENRSGVHRINLHLADIRFLLDKGLYAKCRQLIQSSLKEALALADYTGILELSALERKLVRLDVHSTSEAHLSAISAREEEAVRFLSDEVYFRELYDRNFLLLQKANTAKHLPGEEGARKNMRPDASRASSFHAKALYYIIQADTAQWEGAYADARKFMMQALELFEMHPAIREEQSRRYINLLNNYLNSCFLARAFDEFEPVLEKLRRLQPKSEEEEVLLFRSLYSLEILYLINTQQWQRAEKLIPGIREGLQKFSTRLPVVSMIVLQYNIGIVYFGLKNYGEALDAFNTLIDGAGREVRIDLQQSAHIFRIIAHYELENYDVADTLLYNFRRGLRKSGRLKPLETMVLKLLCTLIDTPGKQEKQRCLQQAWESLQTIPAHEKDDHFTEEISWWIAHKIQGPRPSL